MPDRPSHLIILCGNFPNGYGEPFLDVEMGFLRQEFDLVTVCTTQQGVTNGMPLFGAADGVPLRHLSPRLTAWDKAWSLLALLLGKEGHREIRTILRDYHSALGWGKLKTMAVSWARAKKMAAQVVDLLPNEEEGRIFLYSYWADDAALALTLVKDARPDAVAFCRVHGWDLYFERSRYHYLPFRRRIFNRLDALFAISENGRNYLLSHFSAIIAEGRVYTGRLGIRTVQPKAPQAREFRRFRLVSCSNLIPIKRVETIVRALSLIEGLEVEWTHFGDGPLLHDTEALAQRLLSPKPNIAFSFPGRVPNWQVLRHYSEQAIDLFITVSRYDGIPVSIMEAMSFGIPAVATDVGGVSEIVIDGQTGFLLSQEAGPMDVAAVIRRFSALSTADVSAMRQAASRMYGTYYSADINYPEFCRQVKALGGQPPIAAPQADPPKPHPSR